MRVADGAWRLADPLWEGFAERGRQAYDEGRFEVARTHWENAAQLSETFADGDPRRGASLVCLAASRRTDGRCGEAAALLEQARAAWQRSPLWAADMWVEPRARSSTYHLRLETRHRARYESLAREDHARRSRAGLSTATNNLAELLDADGRIARAEALYGEALALRETALGRYEAGVAVIAANLAGLLEALGRSDQAESLRERARAVATPSPATGPLGAAASYLQQRGDARKLAAALALPPLLRRSG